MAGEETKTGPAQGANGGGARGPHLRGCAVRKCTGRASAPACIATLKRRSEFLRVRKGMRHAARGFVLEAKLRDVGVGAAAEGARFGFTVARQVGKAVERNRIKRRLKAVIGRAAPHARGDCDYVLIARRAALTLPFGVLLADAITALERVHRPPPDRRRRKETGSKLAG